MTVNGSIYLPNQNILLNSGSAGTPVSTRPDTGFIPIANYSDVHVGYVRKLSNVSASIALLAEYTTTGAVGVVPGAQSSGLIIFQLLRNNTLVYNQSSSLTLPTVATVATAFNNLVGFGIYADLVNPIEMRNGDQLTMRLAVSDTEQYLWVQLDGTGATGQYGNQVLQLTMTQGVLSYTEAPDG